MAAPPSVPHVQLSTGKFEVREVDAQAFLERGHSDLVGAPLRMIKSSICDTGAQASLTVSAPPGLSAGNGTKRTQRRPHDCKVLTPLGEQALSRSCRERAGQLWRGSRVWMLQYRCAGTILCDVATNRCAVKGCTCAFQVALTATIEQVHRRVVTVLFSGHHGGASWHSQARTWDVTLLTDQRRQIQPVLDAIAIRADVQLQHLKAKVIMSQRAGVSAAGVVAATQQVVNQKHALAAARRDMRPQYSQADRDRIVTLGVDGHRANRVRTLLARDSHDGASGDAPADAAGAANVPRQNYTQGVLDGARRRERGAAPPYEALHALCHGHFLQERRIILYRVPDPAVDPADFARGFRLPAEAMHMVVFATPAMIDAALDAHELEVDTKWRTNEDGGCVQAIMWYRQRTRPRPSEGYRVEFRAGYEHHDGRVLTICLANLDNYWTLKLTIEAVRAMMPCRDSTCPHAIRRVDLDQRGSFRLERCCAQRAQWTPLACGVDKAAYEVRALRQSGISAILCRFHIYQAILEFLSTKLQLRCPETLWVLLLAIKWTFLGNTSAEVAEKWAFVTSSVLQRLTVLTNDQRSKFIAYITDEWLCERWIGSCTNIARNHADAAVRANLRLLNTSNNSIENFWKFYLSAVCHGHQFKRRDDEARKANELLDNLALSAHEEDANRTQIGTDVHARTLLALAIVIQQGVTKGPNGVFYIRSGISSRNLIHFGAHRPTKKPVEMRVPAAQRATWNLVRVWMRCKLESRFGVPRSLGWGVYCYHPEVGCECVPPLEHNISDRDSELTEIVQF
jgi:hypothetical protein